MIASKRSIEQEARYCGLRMTADQYLALPEDGRRYELVDGVVIMSPSPAFQHQDIAAEIVFQIRAFLLKNPIGKAVQEVDIVLGDDLVYRPDVVYLDAAKAAVTSGAVLELPSLVVEIVSPSSGSYDRQTKRDDYEAAGIGEYWIVDPGRREFVFLRLTDGRYVEAKPRATTYESVAIPGFVLEMQKVQKLFG